jgi:hypothetical protein
MRYLISTICIVLLLWGCDRTADATAQSKVVRKKVVAQKGQAAKVVRKKVVAKKTQIDTKASSNKTIRTARTTERGDAVQNGSQKNRCPKTADRSRQQP